MNLSVLGRILLLRKAVSYRRGGDRDKRGSPRQFIPSSAPRMETADVSYSIDIEDPGCELPRVSITSPMQIAGMSNDAGSTSIFPA